MKSDGKRNANIQLITTRKWINHYENLLTEDRDEYKTSTPAEILIQGRTIDIDERTVTKTVQQLKNGWAAGPEEIPAELIKCGTSKLYARIAWCINQYINGAPISEDWKVAYISSIPKKGNKLDCSNYRGISVTSTLSRLYGRILRDLIEHEYKEQEEEQQSGFRARRTCTDNVLSDHCLKATNRKKIEHKPRDSSYVCRPPESI